MSLFDDHSGATLFEDRDKLLDEHIPNEFVGRDDQIEEFLSALMPVYDGFAPDHAFLFGPNGSGKTASTRYMLRELRNSENADVDPSTFWLRCNGVGSNYMLALKLANRMLPSGEQLNRGHPEDIVYDRLFESLERVGGTILIVLDEIDRIENLDTFLYEITRARSAGGRLDDAKVGVIGISKDSTFYDDLSSDVKSSLNAKMIDFPAYETEELESILAKRTDEAFEPHAVEDDVPPLCAAHGAKLSGDARFALDLLREAGDLAKQVDDDLVSIEHVEQAKDKVLEARVDKLLDNLNHEAKHVVCALVTLSADDNTSPRTKEVYNRYEQIAKSVGTSPVVSVQVTKYLNQIEQIGLTEIHENTGNGGRFNRHTLQYDIDDVVSSLENHIRGHDGFEVASLAGIADFEISNPESEQ